VFAHSSTDEIKNGNAVMKVIVNILYTNVGLNSDQVSIITDALTEEVLRCFECLFINL